jgi:urease accessory protein
MTRSSFHRTAFLALAALMLTAAPASAHHVMGGEMPSTFAQGFLSGLGHPVIGLDHLAFLIAVGVAVGVGGLNLGLPVLVVASSVVIVGALIAAGRALPLAAWGAVFGAAGLAHGYAYGESIFGAEPTPLLAYLLGLVVIQSALSVGVALLFRIRNLSVSAMAPRLAGAVVVGIGIAALLGQIISDA